MHSLSLKILVPILLTTAGVLAQAETDYATILKGEWVVMESLLTSEIESPNISAYFKYNFTTDGVVYHATNEFERGRSGTYKINGDKLEMLGYTFTIKSYEEEMLHLEAFMKLFKTTYSTTLVRKEKYDRMWKLRGETDAPIDTPPVFKGNFFLYDYAFSNYHNPDDFLEHTLLNFYQPAPVPPRHDIFLRVDILVDTEGNVAVKDIRSSRELNDKKRSRIKKKFEKTSGYWIPAKVGGKDEAQAVTLTFVTRGKSSLQLRERGIQYFKMAYQHYQKGDYHGAIQRCNDAISLDQNRFQFYVLRAVCNIRLSDIDKYCRDVVMANSLNPFVSRQNVEVVKGEVLEIKCGEK